ncbi:MAG: hypothetical protein EXR72_08445 [Myxococcales bacterium]|nr:hypothetical protein [Myxococcales bacterium]
MRGPDINRLLLLLLASSMVVGGCSPQTQGAAELGGSRDLAFPESPFDLSFPPGTDLYGIDQAQGELNKCGDNDPGCMGHGLGPPGAQFPLQSDPQPDPKESDNGVDRDGNGWITLSTSKSNFDFVWAANSEDWKNGTVSKINSKSVKETARYFTVTCFSNQGGSRAACDGMAGCCSRDDYQGFQNRSNNKPSGPHQAVQISANSPSRTAVDFNGDMWVSNRAFGGQSSVTKIANDKAECSDRNGAQGIQTSSDVNGDGLIDTDCNGNSVPDDVADVKAKACTNGKAQEFYGFDDECILFTTNTNVANQYGRPMALGRGAVDFGAADAWAGTFQDGKFFRVDGVSGQVKAATQVPGNPYGAAVDQSGILWAPQVASGKLFYFDTGKPAMLGTARIAAFGTDAYGVAMDRDQNVWIGGYPSGNAYRYTPDRSNGFAKLGSGYWTKINNPGGAAGANDIGRGIAADSRTMQKYFVWMGRHPNFIVRIPASDIPLPMGMDVQIDGANFAAMKVAGGAPAGAGVDTDQNIWAISSSGAVATRIKVDAMGTMSPPDIAGGVNGMGCPAGNGDRCPLQMVGKPDPGPYTYSDFTGFGLRNFTNPKGTYAWIQKGCAEGDTKWAKVDFDVDQPASTKIVMRARSGNTPTPDNTWGAWSGEYTMTPADLKANPPLAPNPASYLQIEFQLSTTDKTLSPKLKGFEVLWWCNNVPG